MKVTINVWGNGTVQKLISTVEIPQLNYDPEKGIFGVPTRDADYFYEIQYPVAMKPRIAMGGLEIILVFNKEEDARTFGKWLIEATQAQS